ncbi:MAG TPA: AsmA family protein [Candidatus Binatia bacterium]|nr:AsmA family protein [Candidatus Binatia bacterium]
MRKWIIAGVVLLALGVIAIALVLNLNSLIARNKDYLIAQAEQTLGRKIKVGTVEATLFGGIGVKLGDFSMTDDPAYSGENFVRAKDLQVNLKFWPLLKKEVQIKRVILHNPAIVIIRNTAGRFNFSSIGKKDTESKDTAAKDKRERARKEESGAPLMVSLVDISGGDLRYIDRKDGTNLRLRQIDLKVEDFDLNQPFSVRLAAAVYADKQNLRLTNKFGALRADGDFSRIPLDGQLDLDPIDISRLKTAAPKFKDLLPKDLDLSGVFRIRNLKFKGTLKDLTLNGEIEGTQGAIRYGNSFQKPSGIPLTLNTDGRYSGDRISIRKGQLKLHTLEVATVGDLQFGDGTVLNLSVDSKPAALEGWDKIIPAVAKYQLSGTMEVQAKVRGKAGKGSVPELQGTLVLNKASAKPPQFPQPIENLDTKIRFTGQKADIGDMTLTLGSSRIRLAAAIEKFSPLTLSYKLSTPELRPADYTAALGEERKADVIRNLRSDGQLNMAGGTVTYQGKLSSADGKLYNVAYKDLDATVSLANQVANIRNLRVNALSGAVQVDGEYSFKEPTPRFAVTSKAQNIDVKELYAALDAKAERDLRGRMNADMRLSGSGKNWEEVKPMLRGEGEAEVLQGALLNFNLAEGALNGITGVPGLTNLINPSLRSKYPETFTAKDTEFKELKTVLDVADGRINVKSLRMSAAEFLVQGAGWADFTRKVDFRSTIVFSDRLSADLTKSTREMKYALNNQGQLEVPLALTGRLPNVKPVPDSRYLGQIVQRGLMRRGVEELQDRFLGGRRQQPAPQPDSAPADPKKERRNSTDDLIRRGLEGLFKR